MKVLVLHNRYQLAGGEDKVVESEVALLRKSGVEVVLELVDNSAISDFTSKAHAFGSAIYSPTRSKWAKRLVEQHSPDVVHIHNFFPLLSPAVHVGARASGAAVVQTLHNFRTVCAGGLLLRSGVPCEKCIERGSVWGIVHRCYRGSAIGSVAAVAMQSAFQKHVVAAGNAHRFIALTEFGRQIFLKAGFPPQRLVVKPNFVEPGPPRASKGNGVLFVGRLTPEKGPDVFVDAARQLPHIEFTVVGDGPLRNELASRASSNVTFVGARTPAQVAETMRDSYVLAVPSLCYEGFPVVIAEAFAASLPVLASGIGAMNDIVSHEQNGILFDAGSGTALAAAVRRVHENESLHGKLAMGAGSSFAAHYGPDHNLQILLSIYRDAMIEADRGRNGTARRS